MSMAEVKKNTKEITRKDATGMAVRVEKVLASFNGEKAELIPICSKCNRWSDIYRKTQ